MARLIAAFLTLGLFAACLAGCHAAVDVDPNHASQAPVPH
jgi:hypothetical protein